MGKHCRREREKVIRTWSESITVFLESFLVHESLSVFPGRTSGLVLAACHRHLALGRQLLVALALPAAQQRTGPAALTLWPQSRQRSRNRRAMRPLGIPLGYGKGKRGRISQSLCPKSLWLQLPGSAECWLKGQLGDKDAYLLGRDGA